MSAHNNAKKGDIADFVLLPGDPRRAKLIAETFLTDAKCYNEVRGMLGYTGFYNGKRISVQGTGMGMPSISIYITELIEEYGVETLVRVGSCGSIQEDVNMMDIVLAMSACTDSGMNKLRFNGNDFAPTANFELLKKAYEIAEQNNINTHTGSILTSDSFYTESHLGDPFLNWKTYGVLAVDMETAALYSIAAKYKKKALAILTVSDHILKKQALSADDRQDSFKEMIEFALQLA
ncbi:purine-nucleoside phosphorylase [Flavobacterium collinsii]|jgi:purine-nucleoside phosphorylase|uniref:Uridine phosphorylase n=1 Tax=Flavobacterium collinsii TaxID=1114861 RepID=A0A9W4X434_9FLAO|nr:purine-nucleoside phosphorylase [Flavobacterium collinsii]GIQ59737.1 purine nucleoside phosphorylase DeoD-type [Flavobacterium collinsii]CAA9199323.1 Purine nucleoside phosphorylase DeoD-type [Flavobacterium collinsii]CAI2768010.1 Purine nucleoside phosphorylase DeoD-type [Flavobacterium collinsii]